jgi:hypothetical protein
MARSISAGGDSGPGRGPLDQRMQNNVRIGVSPHGNGDEDSDAYFTDDEEVRRLSELDDGLLVSSLRNSGRSVIVTSSFCFWRPAFPDAERVCN